MNLKYKRILLKLSGEILGGPSGVGYDPETLNSIVSQIKAVHELGVEIGIVVGGGNIFRGIYSESLGMQRQAGDYIGMLATVMNGLALENVLKRAGVETRVMSALEVRSVVEPYVLKIEASQHSKGRVVIFTAGTGNPFFTTDTPAALRGIEMCADVILKATKVDGVYSKDPKKYSDAVKFDKITFKEAIDKQLQVMDLTAFTLCHENNLPIIIFNIREEGNILKIVKGEKVGSLIYNA